ncbi:hypothetical protein QMO39_31880, partial [Pseudomonas aeruginosa]|nr:hypothetical protein [Pseudomonas aeruginosa]
DKRPASRGACIFAARQAWRRRIHNSLTGAFIKTARHEPCRSLTGSHIMSFPTAVNDQITDAVTQSNVKV